jgi:NAD(P)-dependent dehydrogenase (short-subunit alcohol dehydrogenase family)
MLPLSLSGEVHGNRYGAMSASGERGNGRLAGEVVAITGASRGLGAALAQAVAREGGAVAICARDGGALRRVEAEAEALGARVHAAVVDVADEAALREWVAGCTAAIGHPTVLINNASVLGPRVSLMEHPAEEWRRTLEINLTGSFLAARAVLPGMLAAGYGSIVQVSSGAAIVPRTRWGAYSVSKLAADGLALNLAAELRGSGVRVNVVDPGAMRTGMRAEAYPEEDPLTLKTAERTVGPFLWLASRESAAATGQRLHADEWNSNQ